MGAFDCRDDALHAAEIFERVDGFVIGDRHVPRASAVVQRGVLRSDAWVIKTGGNGVHWRDLPVFVLAKVAFHAVEDAEASRCDGRGGLGRVGSATCGFASDELHRRVVDEMVEGSDGVASAADAGEHGVGQAAFLLLQLLFYFAADDGLEIAHHGGEGVRAHDRPQAIMRVVDAAGPFAERFVDGVFERSGAGIYGVHLSSEQAHFVHVERLALGVLAPHVDDAFHVEQRRRRGGGHAVLACAGFGDQARFAHLLR